jgi:hypothetical protein
MSGSPRRGAALKYPEISLQSLVGEWWVPVEGGVVDRGRLLWAVVPHVDQHPFALFAKGRTESTEHGRADYEVKPLTRQTLAHIQSAPLLPVAGMPSLPDEIKLVFRGKRRPVLVVGVAGTEVEKGLRAGGARFHTSRTLLVAPYYGAEKWRPQLIERIRRCAYPQFMWDSLPFYKGERASVLRLDHVQPIGNHAESYDLTNYKLAPEALSLVEEHLTWLRTRELPEGALLPDIRESLLGLP